MSSLAVHVFFHFLFFFFILFSIFQFFHFFIFVQFFVFSIFVHFFIFFIVSLFKKLVFFLTFFRKFFHFSPLSCGLFGPSPKHRFFLGSKKERTNAPTETGQLPQSHAQDLFVDRVRANPSLRRADARPSERITSHDFHPPLRVSDCSVVSGFYISPFPCTDLLNCFVQHLGWFFLVALASSPGPNFPVSA